MRLDTSSAVQFWASRSTFTDYLSIHHKDKGRARLSGMPPELVLKQLLSESASRRLWPLLIVFFATAGFYPQPAIWRAIAENGCCTQHYRQYTKDPDDGSSNRFCYDGVDETGSYC